MRIVSLTPLVLLAACGDDAHTPPVTYTGHGVQITITPDEAMIEVVRVSDNTIVYQSVPGGPSGETDPPTVGAGFAGS